MDILGTYVNNQNGHHWNQVTLLPNGKVSNFYSEWELDEDTLILSQNEKKFKLKYLKNDVWRGDHIVDFAKIPSPQGEYIDNCQTRGDGTFWKIEENFWEGKLGLRDHEDWIFQHIPVGLDVINVDIGMFIGTYAIWAARRCKKVIGFEPHEEHRRLLKDNLALNGVTNVVVHPVALGNENSSGYAFESQNPAEVIKTGTGTIKMTRLDDVLLGEDRIDSIKIDVEGFEWDVLLGGLEVIKKFKPRLIIEIHSHYHPFEDNGRKIEELLPTLGYSFKNICQNCPGYYYLRCDNNG